MVYMQVVNHKGKVYDHRLDTKGRLSFASPHNGEHRLCFSVEGSSLGQDFRVHVDFQQVRKAARFLVVLRAMLAWVKRERRFLYAVYKFVLLCN